MDSSNANEVSNINHNFDVNKKFLLVLLLLLFLIFVIFLKIVLTRTRNFVELKSRGGRRELLSLPLALSSPSREIQRRRRRRRTRESLPCRRRRRNRRRCAALVPDTVTLIFSDIFKAAGIKNRYSGDPNKRTGLIKHTGWNFWLT